MQLARLAAVRVLRGVKFGKESRDDVNQLVEDIKASPVAGSTPSLLKDLEGQVRLLFFPSLLPFPSSLLFFLLFFLPSLLFFLSLLPFTSSLSSSSKSSRMRNQWMELFSLFCLDTHANAQQLNYHIRISSITHIISGSTHYTHIIPVSIHYTHVISVSTHCTHVILVSTCL